MKHIFLIISFLASCKDFTYKHEEVVFKNPTQDVRRAINSLDQLLIKLPLKDTFNVRSLSFFNNQLRVNGVAIGSMNLSTIDHSLYFTSFSKEEKKEVFRLINYLHDNDIFSADELDNIWYHDYRSTPSSDWYQQRRIMVFNPQQDTSGMYIHSAVIGKDGNLLLLAHTLKRH